MISNIKDILNGFGVENWIVQVIVTILLIVSLSFTVFKAIFISIKYLSVHYVNRKLVKDLHPYFSRQEIEDARKNFIETKFQNVPPSQDEEPGRSYLSAAKEQLIPLLINQYFNSDADDAKYYIVLADSGMGKTTFMINLYLKYAYRITPYWTRKFSIKLLPLGDENTLDEISKIEDKDKKNMILLLDAFDEDNEALLDYENRMKEIIDATWRFREIVITCRTQFFPSSGKEPYETGRLKFGPSGGQHVFRKLYISVFSDKDISNYLKKKFSIFGVFRTPSYFTAKSIVLLSPNLMMRPMLLSHIDDLVAEKESFRHSFQVYEALISRWVDRESSKPGIINKYKDAEKYKIKLLKYSKELAKFQYLNNSERDYIGHNDLFKELDEALKNEMIDILDSTERTSRSLLNRNAQGVYKFSHRSIYEYLLAVELFEDIDFVKTFKFDHNLDTCKDFFLSMLSHHPTYSSMMNPEILGLAVDGKDKEEDTSQVIQKVTIELLFETVKSMVSLSLSLSIISIGFFLVLTRFEGFDQFPPLFRYSIYLILFVSVFVAFTFNSSAKNNIKSIFTSEKESNNKSKSSAEMPSFNSNKDFLSDEAKLNLEEHLKRRK